MSKATASKHLTKKEVEQLPVVISLTTAARIVGRSPSSTLGLIKALGVPYQQFNGRYVIPKAPLLAALSAGEAAHAC